MCYLEDPLGVCQESTCISSRMTSALPKCRRTARRPEPEKQPSSSRRARGSKWTAPGTLPRFTFFITEVPTRQTKLPLVGIFSFFFPPSLVYIAGMFTWSCSCCRVFILLFSRDAVRKPRFKACLRKWYLKPLRHVPSSGRAIVRPGIALHAETGWSQSSRIPNLDSQRRRYGDERKALETRSAVFRNGPGTFSRRIPPTSELLCFPRVPHAGRHHPPSAQSSEVTPLCIGSLPLPPTHALLCGPSAPASWCPPPPTFPADSPTDLSNLLVSSHPHGCWPPSRPHFLPGLFKQPRPPQSSLLRACGRTVSHPLPQSSTSKPRM